METAAKEERRGGSDAGFAVAPFAAVLAMVALFVAAFGLSYPLLALLLEQRGYSATLIGLNAAMLPVGLLVAAPMFPSLARCIGGPPLALICCLLLAVSLLAMAATPALWVWFPARIVQGLAIAGLFMLSETWVNLMAPRRLRARLLAVYGIVAAAGFGAGPAALAVTGIDGWPPFLLGICTTLAAFVLVLLTGRRLPRFSAHGMGSVLAFLPAAPWLLLLVLASAAFDQAASAMLPIYMVDRGQTVIAATLVVAVLAAGNVVLQFPLGWLADRWSREGAAMLCLGATALSGLILPLVIALPLALWPLLFVWGAAGYGLYTIALTILGDRFSGGDLLSGNAAFALMWGIGGLAGPAVSGLLMDRFGADALPLSVAAVFVVLLFLLHRSGGLR